MLIKKRDTIDSATLEMEEVIEIGLRSDLILRGGRDLRMAVTVEALH
jgi:hypothetical protein